MYSRFGACSFLSLIHHDCSSRFCLFTIFLLLPEYDEEHHLISQNITYSFIESQQNPNMQKSWQWNIGLCDISYSIAVQQDWQEWICRNHLRAVYSNVELPVIESAFDARKSQHLFEGKKNVDMRSVPCDKKIIFVFDADSACWTTLQWTTQTTSYCNRHVELCMSWPWKSGPWLSPSMRKTCKKRWKNWNCF